MSLRSGPGKGLWPGLSACRQGVPVVIGGRDPAKAAELAGEIGGGAQGRGIAEPARLADIVILAVYYQTIEETIRAAGDLTGKVLVDISNPITEDFRIC